MSAKQIAAFRRCYQGTAAAARRQRSLSALHVATEDALALHVWFGYAVFGNGSEELE